MRTKYTVSLVTVVILKFPGIKGHAFWFLYSPAFSCAFFTLHWCSRTPEIAPFGTQSHGPAVPRTLHASKLSIENLMCSSVSINSLFAVSVSSFMLSFRSLISATVSFNSFHAFFIMSLHLVIESFKSLKFSTWSPVALVSFSRFGAINNSPTTIRRAMRYLGWVVPYTCSWWGWVLALVSLCGFLSCTVTFVERSSWYCKYAIEVIPSLSLLLILVYTSTLGACLRFDQSYRLFTLPTALHALYDMKPALEVLVIPMVCGRLRTIIVVTTSSFLYVLTILCD